jgi:hypothetical protein
VTIAMMENQLATLKSGIDAIKKKKPKKDKLAKRDKYSAPVPGSSKNGKSLTSQKVGGKIKKMKMLPDEEVLSFEQKKDLSETIQTLEGTKLERVIQIIHEGVPEIRDVSVLLSCIYLSMRWMLAHRRVPKRSNSTSIPCPPLCSQNCTILYCVHCAPQNGDLIIPVVERVGSKGRVWTRMLKQRKFDASRPSSVVLTKVLPLLLTRVMTAQVRIRATKVAVRVVTRNELLDGGCNFVLLFMSD